MKVEGFVEGWKHKSTRKNKFKVKCTHEGIEYEIQDINCSGERYKCVRIKTIHEAAVPANIVYGIVATEFSFAPLSEVQFVHGIRNSWLTISYYSKK